MMINIAVWLDVITSIYRRNITSICYNKQQLFVYKLTCFTRYESSDAATWNCRGIGYVISEYYQVKYCGGIVSVNW